ncbi:MAG: EAL domain-containing protein [Acidimicrobiales bacterium]
MQVESSRTRLLVAVAIVSGPLAAATAVVLSGPGRFVAPALAAVMAAIGLAAARAYRRGTDAALRHLQDDRLKLVSLLEESDAAVAILDGDGRYLDLGPRAIEILGRTEESLIGRLVGEDIDPEDRDRVIDAIGSVSSQGLKRLTGLRTRIHASDDRWLDVELAISNRLGDPAVQGLVLTARDISPQLAATKELAASVEQQAGVAQLGRRALEGADPARLALEAVSILAKTLHVDGVELYRHVADEGLLLLETSLGPTRDLAGLITVDSNERLPEVLAITERKTVVVDDVSIDPRFDIPPHLRTGGPHSMLSVPVTGPGQPYGALSVHSAQRRIFTPDDTVFVQSIANALGLALDRRRAEEETLHRAFHDALTGLPNRTLFVHRLQRTIERLGPHASDVGVFVIDLDHFKVINDSLGHELGDALLIEVTNRIRESVRPGDMIARLGGDEFALLCDDAGSVERIDSIASRVAEALYVPIEIAGRAIHVTASIGVSGPSSGDDTAASLLRDADIALYQAKDRGRGGYALFDESHRVRAVNRLETESELRRAVPAGELRVHYQPTVDLSTGATSSVEALVRWNHPTRGLIRPNEFIPIAEQTDLIDHVGRWVLEQACRQLVDWERRAETRNLCMAVNLSARQLCLPDLAEDMALIIGGSGADPAKLCLEITESALMIDLDRATEAVRALKGLGVRIAVDDFGTGYSSLTYLTRLPVDVVKIDRSFITAIAHDPQDRAITRGIIDLAHSLGLTVVAEGVETEQQLLILDDLGCDQAQGFLFARPDVASAVSTKPISVADDVVGR